MKIEILTIHRLNNFGSAFQAMALYQYIKSLGYDTELLDYNPRYLKGISIKNYIGRVLFLKDYLERKNKFNCFIESRTKLSKKRYSTYGKVKNGFPKADLYVAGGDQLWNYHHVCGTDDTYKLTFFEGNKISYGTSLGGNQFSEANWQDLLPKIRGFRSISLRESLSVQQLKNFGIDATWVVDPVLLLPPSVYEEMLIPPKESTEYIFVYLVAKSALLSEIIDYVSKKLHLKVVVYSGFNKKCQCDEQKRNLGPEEVIGYIKNAKMVLSSSFHATIFSIMFRKKFAVILPGENTNERIFDLLSWTNLNEGIVQNIEDFKHLCECDAFYKQGLEQILEQRIESSKDYLKNAIEDVGWKKSSFQ